MVFCVAIGETSVEGIFFFPAVDRTFVEGILLLPTPIPMPFGIATFVGFRTLTNVILNFCEALPALATLSTFFAFCSFALPELVDVARIFLRRAVGTFFFFSLA